MSSLSEDCLSRPGVLFAAVVAFAILALPRPAAAHAAFCQEGPNPAGQIPPAGTSTPPGTTTNGPFNPDGFYTVGTMDCGGTTCSPVALFDAGDGCVLGTSGTLITSLSGTSTEENAHNIKYTEANGITPHASPMAGVVELHVFGQGDLLVCAEEDGTFSNCVCCPVPPPPF